MADSVTWTCNLYNLCHVTLRGPSFAKLAKRRWMHIDYYRKQDRQSICRIRERPTIVEVSHVLPHEQCVWTCVTCGGGFPPGPLNTSYIFAFMHI